MYCTCRAGTTCIVHAEPVQHVLYVPSRYNMYCTITCRAGTNVLYNVHAEPVQHVHQSNCPVGLPSVELFSKIR